jgi:hypothetical protein
MDNAPDLQEAIKRFNQSCAAFGRALAAARSGDLKQYETEGREAYIAVVGSLEWAVKYCLEQFYAEQKTEKELQEEPPESFEKLLRKLARRIQPRFNRERVRDLHEARKLRNQLTHSAALAPYEKLRKVFQVIRRFLIDHLPVVEEQLSSPPLEPHAGQQPPSPNVARAPALQPSHRQEGGSAWLDRTFQEGFQRLRQGRAQIYDATISSLEAEARESLTRHALALLEANRRPSDSLELLSERTEEEIKELLLRSRDAGLSVADLERLHRLVPLLSRYPSLCVEAGWLSQDEKQRLRFKEASLPALLMGRHLASAGAQADRLSKQIGRDRSWAEAAWMAISAGDDLACWAQHLLAERDPLLFLERAVVTCAAFGATPAGTAASEEMATAYHLCVSALVAFAPQWVENRYDSDETPLWLKQLNAPRVHDPDSPWFLPLPLWRRCVLDLADASWAMGASLAGFTQETWQSTPAPLSEMVTALGLPPRLAPEEVRALTALCAPSPAVRRGMLDEVFFRQVFSANSRMRALVEEPFLETWIRKHGIRALMERHSPEGLRALAIPMASHPAGYLLNRAGLFADWHEAWKHYVAIQPEEAVQGWAQACMRLSHLGDSTPELCQLVLEESLERLEALGLKPQALQALRQVILAAPLHTDDVGEQRATQVAILRLLGLTELEWRDLIGTWTAVPALAWRTLLEAEAPPAAIAQWCVQKLRLKERVPQAFRHGPVGVLSHGLQSLSTQDWQLAFSQADECLKWLLEEGDSNALSVLAEACLARAPIPDRFDPTMDKVANVSIPLSMVLWPRVLSRPAGREAFYALVERDAHLGETFYNGEFPYPHLGVPDLWFQLVLALWEPRRGELRQLAPASRPPESEAEARRLLACFEYFCSSMWISEHHWPRVKELFEGYGWPPPSVFPWRVRVEGNPWERPQPSPLLQALVLACAAAHGVDVAAPLATVLHRQEVLPATQLGDTYPLLGYALLRLSQRLPERAHEVLEQALVPEVLGAMFGDSTIAFWVALLRKHGSVKVLTLVDSLAPPDSGLGLVNALLECDPQALRERELRPEFLRPLLIRAGAGAYVPSGSFWQEAWKVARAPMEIPELPQLDAGPWLEELLEKSRSWEPGDRQQLLRHLAGFSVHEQVRRRCLTSLISPTAGSQAGVKPV